MVMKSIKIPDRERRWQIYNVVHRFAAMPTLLLVAFMPVK